MNLQEDFIRCTECGHPDFIEEKVVTIPKVQKRRDEFHRHEPVSNIGQELIYRCQKCNKKVDL